jgi:hypothetical protein
MKSHFTLKQGKLFWVKDMPEHPNDQAIRLGCVGFDIMALDSYEYALKEAIASSIEVANQAETDHWIIKYNKIKGDSFESKGGITYNIKPKLKEGEIYSLECEVNLVCGEIGLTCLGNRTCANCKKLVKVSPITPEKEQKHNFMLKDFTDEVIDGFEVNNPLKSFPSEWSQEEIDLFLKQQKVLTGFLEWYRSKQAVNTFNECSNNYILFEFFKHFSLYKESSNHVQTVNSTPVSPTKVEDKEEQEIDLKSAVKYFIGGYEPDTFIRNESGNLIYGYGAVSINLEIFFAEAMEFILENKSKYTIKRK